METTASHPIPQNPQRHYCVPLLSAAEATLLWWMATNALQTNLLSGGDGTVFATNDNNLPPEQRQRADLSHICQQMQEAAEFIRCQTRYARAQP